ncbi:anti-sigma factor [Bacillus sp. JJ1122]|uniref:anti-sigma factor n=1 Tax=Bacillus sp. JJ1122 TaxID=3122951 RepID=UPI003000D693
MEKMNCDHLIDYFNRSLTEAEKERFEVHLERCPECREELKELVEITGELPYLSEPKTPPSSMKNRILENVFETAESENIQLTKTERPNLTVNKPSAVQKKSWLTPLLAATLLLSLLGNGYTLMKLNEEKPGKELAEAVNNVQLEPSENFLGSGEASILTYNDEMSVIVQADKLKAIEGNEVYQVWLIEDGKPVPAGSFVPDATGSGAAFYKIKADKNKKWDTIAITLEPQPGNELPEGQIVLSSKL